MDGITGLTGMATTTTIVMHTGMRVGAAGGMASATTADTTTTEFGTDKAPGHAGSGALSGCTYSLAWQMLLNKDRAASFNSACREIHGHGRQKRHRIPD
jgi:hypothetical protein